MRNCFAVFAIFILTGSIAQQKAFYRTPAIFDKWVVFTAEGDLWRYDMNTNQSVRLTSHHGMESKPVISPDGKNIVFTGEYEGPSELYMISMEGGIPQRLTYENWRGIKAINWLPDGKILYTTRSESPLDDNQLAKLNYQTRTTEWIPLAQAADGAYDLKGNLYFTRFAFQGSQTKRYQGGTAQNIWKFTGNGPSTCLTCDYTGTSREAMYFKERIYFSSDRDGTMNIWSMNLDGKDLKQHTFSSGFDLLSPSISGAKIIFQRGADLGVYDIESNQQAMLDIGIQSDFDQRRPRWIKNPAERISYWAISPSGRFVALIARGRIFVSSVSGSRWVEVTRKSGIRYSAVSFLDDKNIVYLSDESGEFEIWKSSSDGSGTHQQLTKNSKVLISSIDTSPDGKYIAYSDKDFRLTLYSLADGSSRLIEQNENGGFYRISWMKDSRYLVYAADGENTNSIVKAYEIKTEKKQVITTDRLNSYDPEFSSDQKWLFFASERHLKTSISSPWGTRQPEPYFDKTTKLYALALNEAERLAFLEPDGWSDEKKEEAKANTSDSKVKTDSKPAPAMLNVDWAAAAKRLYEVPLAGRNVLQFHVGENHLFWTEIEANQYDKQKLYALKIGYDKKMDPTLVAEDINGYALSSDRKKLIIEKANKLHITDADGTKIDLEKSLLDLSNWAFQFDPVDDWKQMFNDAWRMERDYFYDRNLHGVDWVATRKRYEPLLERVSDRFELDNLLEQMVGELSALHTFVYGGDKRKSPDDIQIGALGAKLDIDPKGYKISHIYQNDPDYPENFSPLMAPQLKIKAGDILLKINDQPMTNPENMYRALSGKVHVTVKLTLQNNKGEIYEQLVKPISEDEEVSLRYAEWEYTRRLDVEQKTSSQVGYIHLRAMGSNDMNDFVKQFYPVFNRGGLILDVRHNGGGNIDSWVLEKLMRKAWFYWQPRIGKPNWNMQYAFRGHIIVLCDESTGSDGEAVTEGIRRLKLGTIMGTRTWGGEIWLSSSNRLVDGGIATAAEFGVFADGQWLIEGHGVDPDIVVDNEPYTTFMGKDTQLEAAIKFLQDKLTKEPVASPKAPPYPNKSFKYKE